MNPEITTYKIKRSRKQDLSTPTYAFYGNSQGDTSCTNSVEDFLGAKGWLGVSYKYAYIDYMNQNEVDKRFQELEEIRLKELSELKDEDDEYEMELSVIANPALDKKSLSTQTSSFRFIDLNKI